MEKKTGDKIDLQSVSRSFLAEPHLSLVRKVLVLIVAVFPSFAVDACTQYWPPEEFFRLPGLCKLN